MEIIAPARWDTCRSNSAGRRVTDYNARVIPFRNRQPVPNYLSIQSQTRILAALAVASAISLAACSQAGSSATAAAVTTPSKMDPLPGMPKVLDPSDIYSADHAGMLSPVVKDFPSRVYVPNSGSATVDVIDPATFKVIDSFPVGRQPQHVVPSWDLKTLWVLNDLGDSVTEIDPATGKKGKTFPVKDPYNMYFTPDGKYAMIVAEREKRIDFRDPHTMKLISSLSVPCRGVDHMDFSADGRYLIASCEFTSQLLKIDVAARKVLGTMTLEPGGMPQDVKTSPDGAVFYIADMMADGIYLIDGDKFARIGFLPTGKGAHGLYVSRDSKVLYVSNRGEGSVSVVDLATRKQVAKWKIAGKGSPDMGGVSADGKVLWLAGRYSKEVYAFDTTDGHLVGRIPSAKVPTACASTRSPGATPWGIPAYFVKLPTVVSVTIRNLARNGTYFL
jgi:40-residue YVTN family beta-propeller repeat